MPTIVDILTFIPLINTTSERLKAREFFICQYFSFYEQLKFCVQLSFPQKQFLLLLAFCLLLLPLLESVIVLCFVVRYFMSILVLQLS